jgi:hypothetical protein
MGLFGKIVAWLAISTALIFVLYQWALVVKQRRLRAKNAASISLGTALLIIAAAPELYPNLPAFALDEIWAIAAGLVVIAFLLDPPWRNNRDERAAAPPLK